MEKKPEKKSSVAGEKSAMQERPPKHCRAKWEEVTKRVLEVEVDVENPSSPIENTARPGDTVTVEGTTTTIKLPTELPDHTVIFTYTNPLLCGWYLENGMYYYR